MNATAIDREVRRLNELPVRLLQGEYEQLWGEPARSNNRVYLIKRIVWRRQALERGGLSDEARRRALELAEDVELRVRPPEEVHRAYERVVNEPDPPPPETAPSLPPAGTTLVRMYRGRSIEVEVRERSFVWDGREFTSLTAVAEAVTGSAWNGRLFFGLAKRRATK